MILRFVLRTLLQSGRAFIALLLSATLTPCFAADAEAAAVRWSLYDEPQRSFETLQAVIDYGCERLRKAPPSVQNAQARLIQCGAQSGSDTSNRQIKIHYTLQMKNLTLNEEIIHNNTFTILRKAYCPSAQFPYLQEENNAAFRFSCWRCPTSDLAARAPRLMGEGKVRWYRNNLCPIDFDVKKPGELQHSAGLVFSKPQSLPKAFGFADNDTATLYSVRESTYGSIVLLQLASGQYAFFIGDGSSESLQGEKPALGVLRRDDDAWIWQPDARTDYRFSAQCDNTFKIVHKKNNDGRRWQFRWKNFNQKTNDDWRIESVIDPVKQHYLFQYSKQGRLIGLAVQGSKFSAG